MTRFAKGYNVTRISDGVAYQKHSNGKERRTARPVVSCPPRKTMACWGVMARLAIGRSRVRSTCGSRLRSQRSLIVHPAPLITSAPVKKRAVVPMTADGAATGAAMVAARSVLNMHGKKR